MSAATVDSAWKHYTCIWAGATEYVVWERVEDFENGLPPDYICCGRCHEMHDFETGELLT